MQVYNLLAFGHQRFEFCVYNQSFDKDLTKMSKPLSERDGLGEEERYICSSFTRGQAKAFILAQARSYEKPSSLAVSSPNCGIVHGCFEPRLGVPCQ